MQDCVSGLQSLNKELQNQLYLVEKSEEDAYEQEEKAVANSSSWKQVRGQKQLHIKNVLEVEAHFPSLTTRKLI